MALEESKLQELVVGLYDRGLDMPGPNRIIDIGTSKILKSGIWSPYLVNLRPALSYDAQSRQPVATQRRVRNLLLHAFASEIDGIPSWHDHIFGAPEAGTPLASAIAAVSGESLLWQRVDMVGKQGRGSHSLLEGIYYSDQTVLQIDDVVTSGLTKRQVRTFLNSQGLATKDVVVGVDREQGARQELESDGFQLHAVIGATAAFGYLLDAKRITTAEHDYLIDYTRNTPYPTVEPLNHPWKQ